MWFRDQLCHSFLKLNSGSREVIDKPPLGVTGCSVWWISKAAYNAAPIVEAVQSLHSPAQPKELRQNLLNICVQEVQSPTAPEPSQCQICDLVWVLTG